MQNSLKTNPPDPYVSMDDESEAYRLQSVQGSGETINYLDPQDVQGQHLEQFGISLGLGNDFDVPRKVR